MFGLDVACPPPGEYVAAGAARQAAWVLSGAAAPPDWPAAEPPTVQHLPADTAADTARVRERYADARELTVTRR